MNVAYLKSMENIVYMLMGNTVSAKQATRKTVQAAKQHVIGAAYLAGGGFSSQIQCFVFDELLGKLIPVLKPLF